MFMWHNTATQMLCAVPPHEQACPNLGLVPRQELSVLTQAG